MLQKLTLGVILAMSSHVARAEYVPGFTWNRQADWTPGTVHLSGIGNPDDDQLGNPTWLYQVARNANLATSFESLLGHTINGLVWDDSWFDGPAGVWQTNIAGINQNRGDGNPPISQSGFVHNQTRDGNGDTYPNAPLIRWNNPTGKELLLDVEGDIEIQWSGTLEHRPSNDADTEVVIAQVRSTGEIIRLFSQIAVRPADSELLELEIPKQTILAGPNDDIVISIRALEPAPAAFVYHWMNAIDNLNFTISANQGKLTGDYDLDDDVDGSDFLIWQRDFGMNPSIVGEGADGNGDGSVDGDDFLVWQDNFGAGSASAGQSASVPEPATLGLFLTAVLSCGLLRTRRLATC